MAAIRPITPIAAPSVFLSDSNPSINLAWGVQHEWLKCPDPLAKELYTSDIERTKEILQALKLKGRLDDINTTYYNFETPLAKAAEEGNLEKVQLLVEAGAKEFIACDHAPEIAFRSPTLYIAAAKGHTEIVQYLLSKGARAKRNISEDSDYHPRPLLCPLLRKLVSQYSSKEKIEGEAQCLQQLLQSLQPYELREELNQNGQELLKIALTAGRSDIVRILVQFGAKWDDLNDKDKRHEFFGFMIKDGYLDVLMWICENYPIDPNYRFPGGRTFLYLAASYRHKNIVDFLIQLGTDINAVSDQNETYKQYAERLLNKAALAAIAHSFVGFCGFKEFPDFATALSYLSEKDVNATLENGNTLLHLAATWPFHSVMVKEIIPGLLNKGADKSLKNNQNQTPYDVAMEKISKNDIERRFYGETSEQTLKLLHL